MALFVLKGCIQEAPNETAAKAGTEANESKPETPAAKPSTTPDEPKTPKKLVVEETPATPPFVPVIDEPETVPKLLSQDQIAEGWISLFDGYSTFGWEQQFADRWHVEDEQIVCDSEQQPSILTTAVPWTDFELTLEVFLEAGGNSGLFLRCVNNPPTNPTEDCYELNLCDTNEKFKTGGIVGRAQPIAEAKTDGAWHRVKVICEGNWIQAWLDDVHMTDFHDESPRPLLSGRIGLQQNGGTVRFRNVALRPLGTKSLFNGQSLSGWNVVPESKSEFAVEEETIHVSNGPGFLETEGTYENFVLQADYRINGDGLNSGIFFRAMKGTGENPSGGYEFQVHNAYDNGDPRQPTDHGSGAIFRRVKARRVVSQDREWNTIALNASGNRFATWVNGYPTAVWEDDRKPDENPRRGRRDEAGQLSLQGHDPTTDLNFRNLRIAEHP
ncbi:MAG TPA: family 16 glycoside hydrolase [Planctomycetaceae bacterium]|nr:family 16 glycoside hydrolase [Planctomycetaceae bacterium]